MIRCPPFGIVNESSGQLQRVSRKASIFRGARIPALDLDAVGDQVLDNELSHLLVVATQGDGPHQHRDVVPKLAEEPGTLQRNVRGANYDTATNRGGKG